MGKKKNKKLGEIMGDSQVVLFNRYQLDSSVVPKNGGGEYMSRLTLDLIGKNVLGDELNTIHVHFLQDSESLPAPHSFGSYVICHQHLRNFNAMKYMIDSGIDWESGTSFFYGTYSSMPASVEFSLLSGELTQKQMRAMLKKDLEIKQQDEVEDHTSITTETHHQG